MPAKAALAPFDVVERLIAAYETNNRVNEYLIQHLPAAAWDAEPPQGKGRTIAAIVAHIHNVRLMWLKSIGGADPIPAKIERHGLTKDEALRALAESGNAIAAALKRALRSDGRVKGFKPDAAGFLGYMFAHDAHHRGQIAMLARQAGHALPQSAMFGMWEWGSR